MLWLLERRKAESGEMAAIVVRAPSVTQARALASLYTHGEGANVWFDAGQTICEAIPYDGPPEVILRQVRG